MLVKVIRRFLISMKFWNVALVRPYSFFHIIITLLAKCNSLPLCHMLSYIYSLMYSKKLTDTLYYHRNMEVLVEMADICSCDYD
jgi:hypothetical protein